MSSKYQKQRERANAEIQTLKGEIDSILLREDGGYSSDDAAKVDQKLARIEEIKAMLDKLAQMEDLEEDAADEEEDEEIEEVSARSANHPAVIRSRGRKSASNISEHSAKHGYNMVRALNDIRSKGHLTGLEAEAHQELSRNQICRGSFLMPMGDVDKLNRRDLTLTTGAGAVPTYWDAAEFISYLYPIMVGPKLGFKYVDGMLAATKFPRQDSVPTVQAVAEQGAASGSDPDIDQITFNPHTITANVTISRKFAMQSVIQANRYVIEALSRQIAVKLDEWALDGDGSSNRPTGLFNDPNLTNFQVATSNTIAYTDILALERMVGEANALFGNLAAVTSPAGYAKMAITPKLGTTFPEFLVNEEKMLGYNIVRSSQVPKNLTYTGVNNLTALAFGAWQFLVVATFGNGLDVIEDMFTGSKSGDLIITALLDADTQREHSNAFAVVPNLAP